MDDLSAGSASGLPIWHDAWAAQPATLEELWREIGFLSFFGSGSRFVWRGLPSVEYNIESSLSRELRRRGITPTEAAIRLNEQNSIEAARRWGLGHSEHGYASDLHLLAMLQHHGVPTRLVDVTYNPLTALWFACSDPKLRDLPGVLVSMAVSNVPVIETVPVAPRDVTIGSMGDPLRYPLVSALASSEHDGVPFLVEPVVRDARMIAQEGLFIASSVPQRSAGTPMEGFPYKGSWVLLSLLRTIRDLGTVMIGDKWDSFGIFGLIISPALKAQILPVLEKSFNRSHRTMYPDLSGFAVQRLAHDYVSPEASETPER
ncbi:FRG domain-containing protein [Mycetocola sp. 2940]|uniref:FRG domain-containing protein n=1 Tax=Mycetocola sp. 2940 TaxID=3156452 RepID=UPI0033924D9D